MSTSRFTEDFKIDAIKKIDQLSQENHRSKTGSKLKAGLEVAQALAGDKDVLNTLQSARKK
ncbi:hypothetical protein [Thalassospira lohafexi]|uniref:Uncharacterized protein n=1 Tax=Thalassospira lohafexi TaxID=744227 RepID=A0A2N3L0P9_9PROT|nr:hypothetical protein [Thalassospira lohafexi]PKR56296.1 hypothetical protein COO92_21540 [Thalassospira lohafexi]